MNTGDKISHLFKSCKCGVLIFLNEHRNVYESIIGYHGAEAFKDVAEDVSRKMMETDTVVEVRFYPNTPVGFYQVLHFDLDAALDEAIVALEAPNAGGQP